MIQATSGCGLLVRSYLPGEPVHMVAFSDAPRTLVVAGRGTDDVMGYLSYVASQCPREEPVRRRIVAILRDRTDTDRRAATEAAIRRALAVRVMDLGLLPLRVPMVRWHIARPPAGIDLDAATTDVNDPCLPVHTFPEYGAPGVEFGRSDWLIVEASVPVIRAPRVTASGEAIDG